MTPNKMIEYFWNLPLGEAIQVAFFDDFILTLRLWPVWLVLAVLMAGVWALSSAIVEMKKFLEKEGK